MTAPVLSLQTAEAEWTAQEHGSPIFRRRLEGYVALYAPGCLCVVDAAGAERFVAEIGPPVGGGQGAVERPHWAAELWRRAESARTQAETLRSESFRPQCLTLYLNNECNLQCEYCYADPGARPAARLDGATIAAAAEVVAGHCQEQGRPFYLVFHGGGEPSLHRHRVERILELGEQVASWHQIEPFCYIATNGVMPEENAVWLAHHFDLVGLSCDGPAEIHNQQRPSLNGKDTLPHVERTAHILGEEGTPFHARATITEEGVHRQAEIVEYLCQTLSPEEIRFEPVYRGGRAGDNLWPGEDRAAEAFVAHFLEARKVAHSYGVPLSMSGSRPGSIHGPHCNVFRHVLNLVPGGVATACFRATDAVQAKGWGVDIGALNQQTGRFEIDAERVEALRRCLNTTPPMCADCFNRYHCARACPDRCPAFGAQAAREREPGFRCRVQRLLMAALLHAASERLWSEVTAKKIRGPHGIAVR